jgi:prepilin-type N-terminal cleavage/methylation domain-containing protein
MIARRRDAAFSLIELLLVISIIALLLGLLFPAFASARRSAQQVSCLTNLRSLGQAFHMYLGESKGLIPWATDYADVRVDDFAPFDTLGRFLEAPLPRWDSGAISSAPFLCPADRRQGSATGFSYLYHPHWLMQLALGQPANAQRTISMLYERSPFAPILLDPTTLHPPREPLPGVVDNRGRNMLLYEGSARACEERLPPLLFR